MKAQFPHPTTIWQGKGGNSELKSGLFEQGSDWIISAEQRRRLFKQGSDDGLGIQAFEIGVSLPSSDEDDRLTRRVGHRYGSPDLMSNEIKSDDHYRYSSPDLMSDEIKSDDHTTDRSYRI